MNNSAKASTTEDTKSIRMLKTPVNKLVIEFAIPAITIMLITSIYNLINSYFVGQLGTNETAAVGLVFPVMIIIQAIGLFFGQGAGNFISRELGAMNHDRVSKMASTSYYFVVIFGLAVAVLGTVFLKPFAFMLGASDATFVYTQSYLKYILWSTPFMAAAVVLNSILRFQGYSVLGMIGVVAGAVLNAILDPLFIFVFDLGVGGAALATLVSQAVSFLILLVGCFRAGKISITLKEFTPTLYYAKEILIGGAPSLIKQVLTAVAALLMNVTAMQFGVPAIASIALVQKISIFAVSIVAGFGQGLQPVCGFNYGAKHYDRVKASFWYAIKISTSIMLVLAICSFIFAPSIITVFRKDDPNVIEIASRMLRMQCLTYAIIPMVTVGSMSLQTLGKPARASLLAVARQGLFLIPVLRIFTRYWGLSGLVMSQPMADVLAFLLSLPLMLGLFSKMKRESGQQELLTD